MTIQRYSIEPIELAGEDVLQQLERIVHQGNVRYIVIKQRGRTVAAFPLTAGVIGVALSPVLAAIDVLVSAFAHCTIEVERAIVWNELLVLSDHINLKEAHHELDVVLRGNPGLRAQLCRKIDEIPQQRVA
jgi:hypothetical protein